MIDTPRLTLRPFHAEDYEALFDYLSNPAVYRFEPGEPISLEEARKLALKRAQSIEYWAVVLKSEQVLVGHLYFARTEPKRLLTWELGYIFNPAYHNQGYATEASRALIEYGFKHFGIHRVFARCNPENIASWRVMEKIGMRREGHFRKYIYFRKAPDGAPLWQDTSEYAILKDDLEAD